jgi:hypothetical protein
MMCVFCTGIFAGIAVSRRIELPDILLPTNNIQHPRTTETAVFSPDDDYCGDIDPDGDLPVGDQTRPCPYCNAAIFEDSVSCPKCGNYISREDAPAPIKPTWIIIGIIACLAVAALWFFH